MLSIVIYSVWNAPIVCRSWKADCKCVTWWLHIWQWIGSQNSLQWWCTVSKHCSRPQQRACCNSCENGWLRVLTLKWLLQSILKDEEACLMRRKHSLHGNFRRIFFTKTSIDWNFLSLITNACLCKCLKEPHLQLCPPMKNQQWVRWVR